MSKQTGAHTHEEKGKMFQLFFLQDWLFSLSVYFREHALSEKYSFSLAAILAGYHIIGKALEIRIGIRKQSKVFA